MEQQSTLPLELDELERLYNRLDGEAPTVSMDYSRDHLTLLELLESEPASNNFVERLKKHHDLLTLLQSTTNGEYTVFVPVDAGWTESDKMQCHENMLAMHISPHYLSTTALKDWPNLPTLLRTGASNRKPVLQSSFASSGWWINRCNRIVKSNMVARNGIAHLIQRPCPPPPSVDSVVQGRRDLCFASEAIRQLSHEELISTTQAQTLVLPSDEAFDELGSDVVNFLSKTEQGRPYMLALLKLHILPQVTVFCNLIWPKNDTEERWGSSHVPRKIKGKVCYTFASLASDRQGGAFCVTVAFYRFRGLVSMLVNQFARVTSQDHCAMNGAVHVIDRVLLPLGDESATNPGLAHLTVDQLREVLAEYI
ncbi:uncharacterized protein G6M90_00g067840 [Metarhizium brunneum]|uniref:FAS1 domain-containing protein n=1 Tax=Metarhizium brunneum TaxID=500148 RepID=A0A7D5UZR6_9HYPO